MTRLRTMMILALSISTKVVLIMVWAVMLVKVRYVMGMTML